MEPVLLSDFRAGFLPGAWPHPQAVWTKRL
jgi:hypothetical protein